MTQRFSPASADLVMVGGTVLTQDRARPRASALAVSDGTVIAVGDNAEILALAGTATRRIDLAGRTAVPGFIESHVHPYFMGVRLGARLDATTRTGDTIADLLDRIRDLARTLDPQEWVIGYGYDDTLFADGRHPTRTELDAVAPRHRVVLHHQSGHICAVNSSVLELAGFSGAAVDPAGGVIGRDDTGRPDGVLYEAAAFAINRLTPQPDAETITRNLELAGREFARNGITCIHDAAIGGMGGRAELDGYRRAQRTGRLSTRVRGYLYHDRWPQLVSGELLPGDLDEPGEDSELFRIAGVKLTADGSIQGRTARLSTGYADGDGIPAGLLLREPNALSDRICDLHAKGWQVAVHGNGDEAIDVILDAYARCGPGNPRRHRIEHCQTARDDQLDRMAELGTAISFFVKHVHYFGDRHRDIFLGADRAARISPLKSAQDRGLQFGLHSDAPVTPVAPLEGMWCAVTRTTGAGHQLGPGQAIDADRALAAYTSDAARLAFDEDRLGTLTAGAAADIAVLSDDPTGVEPMRIRDITVDLTVMNGEQIYQRDKH